jgi:hypothetical protein
MECKTESFDKKRLEKEKESSRTELNTGKPAVENLA